MCFISEETQKREDANLPKPQNCRQCDEEIHSVSLNNNKNVGDGWLCLDSTAIVKRGEAVVYDEAENVINDLVLACEAALHLRGIHAAILDPLALAGEKQTYRERYKEIEAQIRAAIENAKRRS